jgi:hypothetical protein
MSSASLFACRKEGTAQSEQYSAALKSGRPLEAALALPRFSEDVNAATKRLFSCASRCWRHLICLPASEGNGKQLQGDGRIPFK